MPGFALAEPAERQELHQFCAGETGAIRGLSDLSDQRRELSWLGRTSCSAGFRSFDQCGWIRVPDALSTAICRICRKVPTVLLNAVGLVLKRTGRPLF
jgi:hypothetical protein